MNITVLGELRLWRDGAEVPLPASKKTRALLGYLVLTGRPQRRDHLCELFWDRTDDPRGALRWSLSKIRPLLNDGDAERLMADRERIAFAAPEGEVDIHAVRALTDRKDLPQHGLCGIRDRLATGVLAGLDLPELSTYQAWLTAERDEAARFLEQVARRLAVCPDMTPGDRLAHAQYWADLAPFDPEAAGLLVQATRSVRGVTAATAKRAELQAGFRKAGVPWREPREREESTETPVLAPERRLLLRQSIQFCKTRDSVTLAYATVGEGSPIVKAANWLSHLELDWDAPIWSPLFRQLAEDHLFVRYDERGNGLSDWNVPELSFETFVTDLEAVVDAADLDRFALLGISQGAAVSIEYAVRHPQRISKLILFGGYPAGWRIGADEATVKEREAIITLTRAGWGQDNPAYRQIFSSTFMPTATADELEWFNEFQRRTASPENAARFLEAFSRIDVRSRLSRVAAPTLVVHARGDQRIPWSVGRDLAAAIPGARFVTLDSDNHLLLGREAASQEFLAAVREFLDG